MGSLGHKQVLPLRARIQLAYKEDERARRA